MNEAFYWHNWRGQMNNTLISTIVGSLALIASAWIISPSSKVTAVSAGNGDAYVVHPDTGDLYHCTGQLCYRLAFKN